MRTREDILNELKLHNEYDSNSLRAEIILAEILLDIREHLGRMTANQGVQKWGAKIGPAVIDPEAEIPLTDDFKPVPIEFGGQNRPGR